MDYKVESDIPVPLESVDKRKLPPLHELEVGQSVMFPLRQRASVQSVASRMKKHEYKEFVVKKINDTEARVWRIA